MTTCGWTKGPWVIDGEGIRCLVRHVNSHGVILATRHRLSGKENEAVMCLIASAPKLYEALAALLSKVEREECHHESTHRGGAIWTFCNDCGQKWADDEGGFVPYVEPQHIVKARAALAAARGEG